MINYLELASFLPGRPFLQVSHLPPLPPQAKQLSKLSPHLCKTSATFSVCIFSLILNRSQSNQDNSIIKG